MQKKVTIQDIADALGISRNTVSKAINNTDGIADATRDKILEKAVEMGYKQFSYVASRSDLGFSKDLSENERVPLGEIAMLTTVFFGQSHFATVMLDRFHRELAQMGYTLSIHRVEKENIRNMTLPITFLPERVKGIVCLEMFNRPYDEMICSLGIPVLFVDGPNKIDGISLPCDQLLMDNSTGITRFVNEMLRRGKRRIGFVGDWEHCQSFYERFAAVQSAMFMAGEPFRKEDCIKANFPDDIKKPLFAMKSFPDVFVFANDFVAVDTLPLLKKLGISVPEDILICGFDDSPESRMMTPKLTTIHIHTQIMAYSAAYLLSSRIAEPSLDYRVAHTETELIWRESTGSLPNEKQKDSDA